MSSLSFCVRRAAHSRRYVEEQLLPFVPSSASEAKKKVMVNYYLNSPDAETQDLERITIASRSADNTVQLRNQMHWDRGHKPSRHKIVVPGHVEADRPSHSRGPVKYLGGVETPAGKSGAARVEETAGEPQTPAGAVGMEAGAEGEGEGSAAEAPKEGEAALAQLSADAAAEGAAAEEAVVEEEPEAAAE